MSDRSTKHPQGVDDLLAPPPFGVAETTSDQLLPIATSMEHVLDEDRLPEPEPEPQPAIVEPKPEPVPTAADVAMAHASLDAEELPGNSNRNVAVVVVAVLVLGVGAFFLMNRGDDGAAADPSGQAAAAVSPANGATPGPTPDAPPSDAQAAPSAATLPTNLAALRTLSFEERHAGLARMSGDVPVELHVGLDLIQAHESEEPCRTFSDALSIIESSEDPTTFKWAADEAVAPTPDGSPSCKDLAARLAAVRGPSAEVEVPKPRSRGSRSTARSKPRPPRTNPSADSQPPADPPKTVEPATPAAPSAGAPSVATKLDDDLRGLGE